MGQVFARHLALGDAEVTEGAGVVTRPEEVAAQRWDQVYVTVSSAALRGPWFEALARSIGNATLVLLQPGPDVDARAVAVGDERGGG